MIKKFLLLGFLLVGLPALATIKPTATGTWAKKKSVHLDLNSEPSLKKFLRKGGPLGEWLHLKLAEYYLDNQQPELALNHSENVAPSSLLGFWANTMQAKAMLAKGLKHQAEKLLSNLPAPPMGAPPMGAPPVGNDGAKSFYRELYWQALEASLLALDGRGKTALEAANTQWTYFPDKYDPLVALRRAEPTLHHRIERARILSELNMASSIPTTLTLSQLGSEKLSQDQRCQGLSDLGKGLKQTKKTPETLQVYDEIIKRGCAETIETTALYWKAQLEGSMKNELAAIATYELLIKKFPQHRYTDDAYFQLWKLNDKLKNPIAAQKAFNKLLSLDQGDMRSKVLWDQAYADFKAGDFHKALSGLDKILAGKNLSDESHPQALYWQARSHEKLIAPGKGKASATAKVLYQKLIDENPFSFYSVLASHRLKKPHLAPAQLKQPMVLHETLVQELVSLVDALNEIGQCAEAQKILDLFTQTQPNLAPIQKSLLALKWQESQNYHRGLTMAVEILGKSAFAVDFSNSPLVTILYPIAFEHELKMGTDASGLPKSIIHGIMREESLFRTEIGSSAGARGLMQLMPSTAKIQAKKIAMTGFNVAQLIQPETNIILGSTYLENLLQGYQGRLPLAIMAYNAGPGNVDRWLKTNGGLPIDEFIEECPFSETRGYVKRVLRSIQIYGHLLDEPELENFF